MRKYLFRYLIFWLPAAVVAYLFTRGMPWSHLIGDTAPWHQIPQWFTAFFMVFGWSANTGMAAYHYPRATLSALLCYTGFNILITVTMYTVGSEGALGSLLWSFGGILSFKPLSIFVTTLKSLRPPWPWEMILLCGLVACMAIGFIVGLVQRRVNPNPYSPRIRRTKT